ncbi:MAG TPA: RNA polymerase sigma factor [Steroidobacteraceae bacterium]
MLPTSSQYGTDDAPHAESGLAPLQLKSTLGDLSDESLVERALGRDTRAFETLMRRYNRRLFRIARSVLRDSDAAEDAVQEAYIQAFTHLDQYQPQGRFGAWLGRLALNEALMIRRSVRNDTVSLDQLQEEPTRNDDISLSAIRSTSEYAESIRARQLLEDAVDALPDDFRTVFVLRMVEELSGGETAAILGLKEVTVRTRLHRAQRLLRAELTRRLRRERLDLFQFAGARCDRIVEAVLARLEGRP